MVVNGMKGNGMDHIYNAVSQNFSSGT